MIEPKKYKIKYGISKQQFLENDFSHRADYYIFKKSLYKNTIFLYLIVDTEDNYMVISVVDNNGFNYIPFFNSEERHGNLVYQEVIKKYNNIMDNLLKAGILEGDS